MRIRDWFGTKVYISLPDDENGFNYRSEYGWLSSKRWFVPFARIVASPGKKPATSTIPLPDAGETKFRR